MSAIILYCTTEGPEYVVAGQIPHPDLKKTTDNVKKLTKTVDNAFCLSYLIYRKTIRLSIL